MGELQTAIEILSELVAARSENHPGDGPLTCSEAGAAAVVARYFDLYGIGYRTYEKAPGRTNIIGKIGSGGPVLIIPSHLDTVPAGAGWRTDPFALHMDAGRARGRGACDDKAAMAASLIAAARLARSKARPGGTVLIAGIADEEKGNTYGAKYLLQEEKLMADFAIVPDAPSHMRELDIAEKGMVSVRVTSYGKASHASLPERGVNAVVHLARLAATLSDANLASPPHNCFTPATMNVGTFSGGVAPNVVPDMAVMVVDFRILPGMTQADAEGFVRGAAKEVKARYGEARFEVEVTSSMPPHDIALAGARGAALVEGVQEAAGRALGRTLTPVCKGGVTFAKEFVLAGIPAIALGPGDPAAPHVANEWIETEEIIQLADFLVEAVDALLARR